MCINDNNDHIIAKWNKIFHVELNSQPLKPLKTFWVTTDFVAGIFLNALRNQYDLDTPVTKDILTGNGTNGYNEQRRCFSCSW